MNFLFITGEWNVNAYTILFARFLFPCCVFFYHLTHITVSQSVGELDQVRFVLIWNSNNFRYFIYLMKREIYGNERKRCDECNHASAHVKKRKHTHIKSQYERARSCLDMKCAMISNDRVRNPHTNSHTLNVKKLRRRISTGSAL